MEREALEKIRPLIDTQDRKDAAKHFFKCKETINRYLRGEIKNKAFAIRLIEFFTHKIENRI